MPGLISSPIVNQDPKKEKREMKKAYCTQNDGNCETCSLVNYGRDCMNKPIKGGGEMEITEKVLLNGYQGFTEDGSCSQCSVIDGKEISWTYRRNDDDGHCPCCLPGEAEHITLDHEWEGTIPLDESHGVHPAIAYRREMGEGD